MPRVDVLCFTTGVEVATAVAAFEAAALDASGAVPILVDGAYRAM